MRTALITLLAVCAITTAALLAQSGLSDTLALKIRAHTQQARAHAAEGRELQAAISKWQDESRALDAEAVSVEQELRDALHPVDGTRWNWATGRFEAAHAQEK